MRWKVGTNVAILAILAACGSGCRTSEYSHDEHGPVLSTTRLDEKAAPAPSTYTIEVTGGADGDKPYVVAAVNEVERKTVTWKQDHAAVEVRKLQCKGYFRPAEGCEFSTAHFVVGHLLYVGFIYDLILPFLDYEGPYLERTPSSRKMAKDYSEVVDVGTKPATGTTAVLELGERKLTAAVTDGKARWALPPNEDFGREPQAKVTVGDVSQTAGSAVFTAYQQKSFHEQSVADARQKKVNERFIKAGCVGLAYFELVQKLGPKTYELVKVAYDMLRKTYIRGEHVILETTVTEFTSTGKMPNFSAKLVGKRRITMNDGFDRDVKVVRESAECKKLADEYIAH